MNKDVLTAAANAVYEQLAEFPEVGIPVDPDVADFMGAFQEDALSPEEVDLAALSPEEDAL